MSIIVHNGLDRMTVHAVNLTWPLKRAKKQARIMKVRHAPAPELAFDPAAVPPGVSQDAVLSDILGQLVQQHHRIAGSVLLGVLRDLGAKLVHPRRDLGAEVFRLPDGADLEVARPRHRVGAPLGPLDRLFH
jgi:hypothetical protein